MKKSFLTGVKAALLSCAFAAAIFAGAKTEAKAATQLNVNQEYFLDFEGRNESYDYQFTSPAKGTTHIEVTLTSLTNKSGEECWGDIYTKMIYDYRTMWDEYTYTERGMDCSEKFSLNPGKTVQLSIKCGSKEHHYKVRLKIVNEVPTRFETEYNGSASKADSLKVKKDASGVVTSVDKDVDWYVFKAPKTGYYKFSVVNTEPEGWCGVHVEGYKSKNKVDSNNCWYSYQGKGWESSKKIKLKKGKKYYIKISDFGYKSVSYKVRVKKCK
ncbi:hypothetical protein [Butyrivibrio sp. AE3006]|uniref:hypothetical protein n=1 Tax=Butyrivibrio sp. AE3006 TaxID=1280673 RepID=UPI00041B6815|nr:hypothetical protein [Butyrivibrio sp. AE3006]